MTPEELLSEFGLSLGQARLRCVETVGVPVVACIEGMGFMIVPAWAVEALIKVMQRAALPTGGTE